MPVNKFFQKLDINKIAKGAHVDFSDHLAATLHSYSFSLVWTEGTSCSLNYLGANRPPSTTWHHLISRPIQDDDGEISIEIGTFPVGTVINLSYGVFAIDPIPRMAILITNIDTRTVFKIPPGNQFKKLQRGESWTDMSTITLQ